MARRSVVISDVVSGVGGIWSERDQWVGGGGIEPAACWLTPVRPEPLHH
jgi:hypothetical protein